MKKKLYNVESYTAKGVARIKRLQKQHDEAIIFSLNGKRGTCVEKAKKSEKEISKKTR